MSESKCHMISKDYALQNNAFEIFCFGNSTLGFVCRGSRVSMIRELWHCGGARGSSINCRNKPDTTVAIGQPFFQATTRLRYGGTVGRGPRQSSVGRNRLKGFRIYRIARTALASARISLPRGYMKRAPVDARVHVCTWKETRRGNRGEKERKGERKRDGTYFEDYQSLVTCKGSNYPGADWAPFAAPTARLVHPRWW